MDGIKTATEIAANAGADDEQAAIVTWLRFLGNQTHDPEGLPYNQHAASVLRSTADAIERGDHRKNYRLGHRGRA